MDLLIIFAAKYLLILSVLITLYLGWKLPAENKLRYLIYVVATGAIAYICAKTLSHFYFDPRPFVVNGTVPLIPHAPDNGFPSDHTLLAATLAAITTIFNRNLGIISWICVLLIGAARVAASVHHPIDIAGSVIIAICAAILVATVLSRRRSN